MYGLIDYFIGYAPQDVEVTAKLGKALFERGFLSWIRPPGMPVGSTCSAEAGNAIDCCRAAIFVMSRHSPGKAFLLAEIDRCLARDKSVIPFRVEPMTPGKPIWSRLKACNWLDAYGIPGGVDEGIDALAAGMAAMLTGPKISDFLGMWTGIVNEPKGSVKSYPVQLAVAFTLDEGLSGRVRYELHRSEGILSLIEYRPGELMMAERIVSGNADSGRIMLRPQAPGVLTYVWSDGKGKPRATGALVRG